MRTIPESIQTLFTEQQGIQPTFVIGIKWDGVNETKYSTQEFSDTYKYVKEFSNFESVSNTEGLGAVSSITVTFIDQFGHFLNLINTVNILTTAVEATVYITDTDGTEYFDLFEGKLHHPIEWNQADKTLQIEVVSDENDGTIGYTPTDDEITVYETLYYHELNLQTWPKIIGQCREYEAVPIFKRRAAEFDDDMDYVSPPNTYAVSVNNTEPFTNEYNSKLWYNVVGKDQGLFSTLINGTMTAGTFTFDDDDIYAMWYQEVPCTILSKGILGSSEADQRAIFQISYDGSTLGPKQSVITEVPWLQFMNIDVEFTYAGITMNGETISTTTRTESFYVIKQRKLSSTTAEVTLDRPFPYSDAITVLGIKRAYKSMAPIFKIPMGSKIYALDDYNYYVVDTDDATTVNRVAVQVGDEQEILDSSLWSSHTTALWAAMTDCTYIKMPNEVHLRYLATFEEDGINEGILVRATSAHDTDQEAIANFSGLTCIDTSPDDNDFGLFEEEDLNNILAEIAWQSGKAIRRTRSGGSPALELIDLVTPPSSVFTFTDDNVLRQSVVYTYSSEANLFTKIFATIQSNDMLAELIERELTNNTSLYGDKEHKVDFYANSNYETILDFWMTRLSNFRHTVKFTGFLDAFGLEVWDRVYIDFAAPAFYDASQGTPLTKTHSPTVSKWSGYGFIRDIQPEIENGVIHFTVELATTAGESPNA